MIAHHTPSNKITDLHVVLEQLSPSFITNADHVMVLYNRDVAVSCVAVVGEEMLLLSSCVSSGWWQHNDEKTRSGGWTMAPTPTNERHDFSFCCLSGRSPND